MDRPKRASGRGQHGVIPWYCNWKGWVGIVFVTGALLRARALTVGWMLDDYAQRAFVEGHSPIARPIWDLYAFVKNPAEVQALQDVGRLAWWSDPELRVAFFRPVTSLLAALDYALFGRGALGPHLHSLLWWGVLLLAASALFRRVLPSSFPIGRAAVIALLAYALEEGHTLPLAWIANRNAILASAFGVASLWVGLRARDEGSTRGTWAAAALFAIALLGGEYAIATVGYVVAIAACDRTRPLAARARWAAPWLVVAAVHFVLHHALGYGAAKFPFYFDPASAPVRFVPWSLTQMGSLLVDLVLGTPSGPPARPAAIAMAFVVLAILARVAKRSRALLLGSCLSLLPLSAVLAGPRMLALPAVGVAAAVGEAIDCALSFVGEARGGRPFASFFVGRVVVGFGAVCLLAIHFVWAPMRVRGDLAGMQAISEARERAILAAPVDDATAPRERWILLSVFEPTTMMYFATVRRLHDHPLPRGCFALTMAPGAQIVTREDERTFSLRSPRSGLYANVFATVMRPVETGLEEGTTVRAGGLEITVAERNAFGPSTLRIRADVSLDDPSLRFLVVTPFGFERYRLPAVGETSSSPPAADPILSR